VARAGLLTAVIGLLASAPQQAKAGPPTGRLAVDPQTVEVDMTFTGAAITVVGEVPVGYEAALRLTGHAERQELKKLGKRAHVLWMSVGDVTIESVPVVYQVLTSAPLHDVASPSVLARWTLGYDFLIPEQGLRADLRREFVRLKEHEGLFAIREGALSWADSTTDGSSGSDPNTPRLVRGTFRLPARVRAGDYLVELIGFRDRQAATLASKVLRLEHVGAVKQLRRFAIEHGLAYGIAASLIAIATGLLTGLLLRPKSDEAH
jgi:hypothetical protein